MEMNQSSKANLSDNKLSAKVEYATWIKGDDKIYNVFFAKGSKTKKKFKVDITYVHNSETKLISNKDYESGKKLFFSANKYIMPNLQDQRLQENFLILPIQCIY